MQKVFTAQQQKFTLAVTEIGYNNSLPFENVWYKYSFSGPDGVISQDNDFYAPPDVLPKTGHRLHYRLCPDHSSLRCKL